MTNEELAIQIQNGQKDLLHNLWEQVERFVSQQAGIRARQLDGYGGVSYDDLYQSGFLALVEAVQSYDQEKGMSFVGWLAFHLKNAFRDATGYQTDAIHRAKSIDAPLNDEDDMTLAHTIPDPTDSHEATEERIYREQLRNELEKALGMIPEDCADTIRRQYFQSQTLKQIGEQDGISTSAVRQKAGTGLRKLRNPKISRGLRDFVEENTPYYLKVGVARFNNSHSSAVEEIAMIRERLIKDVI
jgi:RNA polymerase sigma factor (sigma-70 family)